LKLSLNALITLPLILGTMMWLLLVLASMLFPPKRGSQMRITEKALVFFSSLLLVTWTVVLMTYTA
jgi:hypothetical protein